MPKKLLKEKIKTAVQAVKVIISNEKVEQKVEPVSSYDESLPEKKQRHLR